MALRISGIVTPRIAQFSVAQGAEEHCEAELWLKNGKSESRILISHNLDMGVFTQLVIISVFICAEGGRCLNPSQFNIYVTHNNLRPDNETESW